jgi:glycosyltransferase involved in cell wall biosynthesis
MSNVEPHPDLQQISVIVPVKNEAASIRQLLQGLSAQTCPPSEIVITDGGSTDLTREIVRESSALSTIPIKLIETESALPGRGRNMAIAHATHEWIACIDAGNRPHVDWLQQLRATAQCHPDAEVIYGVAEPLTDTYFTECAAITFIPNGRATQSIASCLLRRSAWSKAGGFREDLRSAEDLLFFKSLDAARVPTTECANAVVVWELQRTLADSFRRFTVYSRNNMRAGLFKEWQYNVGRLYLLLLLFLIAALWFWPLVVVPLAILLVRAEKRIQSWYGARSPELMWREMLSLRRVLTVAVINVVIDIAALYGLWQWVVNDRGNKANHSRASDTGSLGSR